MANLLLEWQENQTIRTQTIDGSQTSQTTPITIGRHEGCIVKIEDPSKTVSGVHGGIFFAPEKCSFYLMNLTRDRPEPNPIRVDDKIIKKEIAPLHIGTCIRLGRSTRLRVKAIYISKSCRCNHVEIQHVLPLQFLHGNCPYCGSVVVDL